MSTNELKTELFNLHSDALSKAGATSENTDVVTTESVPVNPKQDATIIGRFKDRFVTLVVKWGSLGFILFVTTVQSVPEKTTIYSPPDGSTYFTNPTATDVSIDYSNIDASGSAQLWITEFGSQRDAPIPTEGSEYRPYIGDKIRYVPAQTEPPAGFVPMITGSYLS